MQYSALEIPATSSGDVSAHQGDMGDFQGVPDSTWGVGGDGDLEDSRVNWEASSAL